MVFAQSAQSAQSAQLTSLVTLLTEVPVHEDYSNINWSLVKKTITNAETAILWFNTLPGDAIFNPVFKTEVSNNYSKLLEYIDQCRLIVYLNGNAPTMLKNCNEISQEFLNEVHQSYDFSKCSVATLRVWYSLLKYQPSDNDKRIVKNYTYTPHRLQSDELTKMIKSGVHPLAIAPAVFGCYSEHQKRCIEVLEDFECDFDYMVDGKNILERNPFPLNMHTVSTFIEYSSAKFSYESCDLWDNDVAFKLLSCNRFNELSVDELCELLNNMGGAMVEQIFNLPNFFETYLPKITFEDCAKLSNVFKYGTDYTSLWDFIECHPIQLINVLVKNTKANPAKCPTDFITHAVNEHSVDDIFCLLSPADIQSYLTNNERDLCEHPYQRELLEKRLELINC